MRAWCDSRDRQVAGELMRRRPAWLVVRGPYWRCWSAFARFGEESLVVHGPDVVVLQGRMREFELAAHARGWR